MPTRNVSPTPHHENLIEADQAHNASKLQALQAMAAIGFGDLDQGHYRDLRDSELEDFISGLGRLSDASRRR